MISVSWLNKRQPYWSQLESLLARVKGQGLHALSRSELRELGLLYRQTATDLAAVRGDPSRRTNHRDADKEEKVSSVESESAVQQLACGHGAQWFCHHTLPGGKWETIARFRRLKNKERDRLRRLDLLFCSCSLSPISLRGSSPLIGCLPG
jgi:hypothetical protein